MRIILFRYGHRDLGPGSVTTHWIGLEKTHHSVLIQVDYQQETHHNGLHCTNVDVLVNNIISRDNTTHDGIRIKKNHYNTQFSQCSAT